MAELARDDIRTGLDHLRSGDGQLASRLAHFAADLRFESVPELARHRAKMLILDAIGVGLASNAYAFADVAIAGVRSLGGDGECSVLGRAERLAVRDAALANGILIHGLDFDDTHLTSIVHPTAACLPCALSLAESLQTDGRRMLTAYMAGMESAVRIGAAIKGGFHHVGFHATGVIAHFSSAIVAARLLDLDADRIVAAQGIAASTAAGIQVFLEEGAWTKRFHPGWAAVAGITAARLSQHGFVGPTRPYEGKFGLFDTHLQTRADHVDPSVITTALGERFDFADTAIKPYPVCHFIHGCADAAIELSAEIGNAAIREVEAFLPQQTLHIVAEPAEAKERPSTEYEAKFSTQFVVATCLLKGRFGLPELQDDALREPAVRELAKKVRCSVDRDTAFPTYFSGAVAVVLADGRRLFRHVRVNSGAGERALPLDAVVEKFMASASLAVPTSQAESIRDIVLSLEDQPVSELTAALRSGDRNAARPPEMDPGLVVVQR